jgi:GntR family transcriptional regulator, sialic acid-inducible nan operon repressor
MTMPLAISSPIRKRKLYEEIVYRLEQSMLDGSLSPGEQLPSERELVETFQVGRTAVREALFALNRMGLVSMQNGERAVVTKPTASALLDELSPSIHHMLQAPDGIRNFQGARELFEIALVRHAAAHANADEVARLARALELNKQALGDEEAFIETDVGFHFVLAEIASNPIFTSLHAAIAGWLKEQRAISVRQPSSSEHAFNAHQRIYKAVASHDVDGAERAMRQHLKEVSSMYWQAKRGVN